LRITKYNKAAEVKVRKLISSLEEGKCNEKCKKALLKLFYYHI